MYSLKYIDPAEDEMFLRSHSEEYCVEPGTSTQMNGTIDGQKVALTAERQMILSVNTERLQIPQELFAVMAIRQGVIKKGPTISIVHKSTATTHMTVLESLNMCLTSNIWPSTSAVALLQGVLVIWRTLRVQR